MEVNSPSIVQYLSVGRARGDTDPNTKSDVYFIADLSLSGLLCDLGFSVSPLLSVLGMFPAIMIPLLSLSLTVVLFGEVPLPMLKKDLKLWRKTNFQLKKCPCKQYISCFLHMSLHRRSNWSSSFPPTSVTAWRMLSVLLITPLHPFSLHLSFSSFWPQQLPLFAPFHLTSQWNQTSLSWHGITGEWEGVGLTARTGLNTLPARQAWAERLRAC